MLCREIGGFSVMTSRISGRLMMRYNIRSSLLMVSMTPKKEDDHPHSMSDVATANSQTATLAPSAKVRNSTVTKLVRGMRIRLFRQKGKVQWTSKSRSENMNKSKLIEIILPSRLPRLKQRSMLMERRQIFLTIPY